MLDYKMTSEIFSIVSLIKLAGDKAQARPRV